MATAISYNRSDALLDRQEPVLADHRDVFGVVDRELHAFPPGDGDQIDGGEGRGGDGEEEDREGVFHGVDSPCGG